MRRVLTIILMGTVIAGAIALIVALFGSDIKTDLSQPDYKVTWGTIISNGAVVISDTNYHSNIIYYPMIVVRTKDFGILAVDIRGGSTDQYRFNKDEKVKLAVKLYDRGIVGDSWLLNPQETPFNKAPK